MKAIQIKRTGGPEVLEPVELPTPKPGPGEVLVKSHAIGVSYAEILLRTGKYKWMPNLPFVPGNAMAGRIADANGSKRFKDGQPVFMASWDIDYKGGLYAEYVVVPERAPWPLPDNVDLDHAAAFVDHIMALCFLRLGARGAETKAVAIRGSAGAMGTALTDLCQLEGATVIGLASSAEKCAFTLKRGATHAVNYKTEDVVQTVRKLTDGRGVDIVFNHVAGDTFRDDLQMLAPLGMVVSFAAIGGMPSRDVFLDLRANLDTSAAIRVITMHTFDHLPEPRNRVVEEAIALLGAGKISPAIGARFPLADAAGAHRLMEAQTMMGKILLKP